MNGEEPASRSCAPNRPHASSFKAVLSVLTRENATALLRQRLDLLADRIAETREALANYRHEVPRRFLVESSTSWR